MKEGSTEESNAKRERAPMTLFNLGLKLALIQGRSALALLTFWTRYFFIRERMFSDLRMFSSISCLSPVGTSLAGLCSDPRPFGYMILKFPFGKTYVHWVCHLQSNCFS